MDRMWTRLKIWPWRRDTSPPETPDQAETVLEVAQDHSVTVLFVCMGNICRSPMAEGVLRRRLEQDTALPSIGVDSAGTHSYHVGAPPDQRAQAAAARRGIDISAQRARRVVDADFERFDYILAMDRDNLDVLLEAAAEEFHHKIRLFLDFSRANPRGDVPDPYYGGTTGFERVLDLVEEAADGLIEDMRRAGRRD